MLGFKAEEEEEWFKSREMRSIFSSYIYILALFEMPKTSNTVRYVRCMATYLRPLPHLFLFIESTTVRM